MAVKADSYGTKLHLVVMKIYIVESALIGGARRSLVPVIAGGIRVWLRGICVLPA
jgi:hypothetical protein